MAIPAGKIGTIENGLVKTLDNLRKWRMSVQGYTVDPKGGDVEIALRLKSATSEIALAAEHLRSAQEHVASVHATLLNRKAARAL